MTDHPFYSSAELVEVIETIRTPRRFFLDRFFPGPPRLSTSPEIVFDEVLEDLPVMAPFVSPVVQAKPQRRSGFQAKSFTPAYVKPKHFIRPGDFVQRTPGEPLMGNMSPAQRYDAERLRLLELQKRQIEERWEWMAAKAIVDAKVTISGEDYPEVEVDFGRSDDNEVIVTGAGNVWSNKDADIAGMLEDWSTIILEKTGYAGGDVIMAPEIWKHVRKNAQLLKEADLRRGAMNVPSIQPQRPMEGVRYVGAWGEFNLWVFAGRFKDQDGTLSRAIGADHVVMAAPPDQEMGMGGVHGIKAFGAIQDKAANMMPIDIFPKSWEEDDPSGEQLMSQSAPLMIPGRPNATLKAKVV